MSPATINPNALEVYNKDLPKLRTQGRTTHASGIGGLTPAPTGIA